MKRRSVSRQIAMSSIALALLTVAFRPASAGGWFAMGLEGECANGAGEVAGGIVSVVACNQPLLMAGQTVNPPAIYTPGTYLGYYGYVEAEVWTDEGYDRGFQWGNRPVIVFDPLLNAGVLRFSVPSVINEGGELYGTVVLTGRGIPAAPGVHHYETPGSTTSILAYASAYRDADVETSSGQSSIWSSLAGGGTITRSLFGAMQYITLAYFAGGAP